MFLFDLIAECSPNIHQDTMSSLIQTESSINPYAIAIVKGFKLKRQPKSREEAEAIIDYLDKNKINYSVGIAQINRINFSRFNLTGKQLLDPCLNLQVSQVVLQECFAKYKNVNDSLSCYYSGNNRVGYKIEKSGDSYVARVHKNFKKVSNHKINTVKVPSIKNEIYVDNISPKTNNLTINNSKKNSTKKIVSAEKTKSFFAIKSGSILKNSVNEK